MKGEGYNIHVSINRAVLKLNSTHNLLTLFVHFCKEEPRKNSKTSSVKRSPERK